MGSVAQQHDVVEGPALTQDAAEVDPGSRSTQMGRIGQQRMTIEMFCEDALAQGDGFFRLHLVKPKARPCFG